MDNEFKSINIKNGVKSDIVSFLDRIRDMPKDDWQWEMDRFTDKLKKCDDTIKVMAYEVLAEKIETIDKSDEKKFRQTMDLYYSIETFVPDLFA